MVIINITDGIDVIIGMNAINQLEDVLINKESKEVEDESSELDALMIEDVDFNTKKWAVGW